MAKKLYGTDPDQVPTNADLGTTAYTNVQAMPKVVIGEPQEGIRFVDPYDNYALRINGNEYYSSGAKLSRTGSGGYTGTLQFEKIKTDADGNAVDGKSGDRLIQIYSSVTNDAGAFCDGPSITGDLLADVGSATQATGRLNFKPNGGTGVIASIDSDGLKFNGDTAAANALDDYEEGTYETAITASGSGTVTLNAAYDDLSYVKVGNIVHVQGFINISSVSSPTGYFTINLPFTSKSGDAYRASASLSLNAVSTNNVADFWGIVDSNTNYIQVYLGDSSSVQTDSAQTLQGGTDCRLQVTYQVA